MPMTLEKYSMGVGDRFGSQGKAQLAAFMKAKEQGVGVTPVWNKSHREHGIIGSSPADVQIEADAAVQALGWEDSYRVDADHIGLNNVDAFIEASDFFTFDVAESIGGDVDADSVEAFVREHSGRVGALCVPEVDEEFQVVEEQIRTVAVKYLPAVQEAGRIYRHIVGKKGEGNFISEVSMDETDITQTPVDLFFILAAIADEGIPAQTIAPKFTGRFNKGVDYVGDVELFEKEFNQDIAVINYAIKEFGLPENMKLSVHSGSDKFGLYGAISRAIKKFDAGLHVKTAGTTWLEEIIGLAAAGGDGLAIAKKIYASAYSRFDELCGPYASVIDIDRAELPSVGEVDSWTGRQFKDAVAHDLSCSEYNLNVRQLLHVGYKVAAELGDEYIDALKKHEGVIAEHVAENIYRRHILPIFGG